MAKHLPQITSDTAADSFKTKISESLPLLDFLNNGDKADIWRFWKTVSSAVKIAVNGRGDIVETTKRNSKPAVFTRDAHLEEHHLQHLDTAAITIYIPVKCSEKGSRRFRVLKLVNQQKVADYFETVHAEDEDASSENTAAENSIACYNLSQVCNAGNSTCDNSEKIIEDNVSCIESDSQGLDEDLQSVASFLKANGHLEEPLSLSCSENIPIKLEKSKPLKKIWPVGRPTTRSSSGARVIKDKIPENDVSSHSGFRVHDKIPENEVSSQTSEFRVHADRCSISDVKPQMEDSDEVVTPVAFHPDIKQETLDQPDIYSIAVTSADGTTLPLADNPVFSTDDQQLNTHLTVIKSEISELCSASENQIYSHGILSEDTLSGYSVHVSLPVMDSNINDHELNKEFCNQTHAENQLSRQSFVSETDIPLTYISTDESCKQNPAQDHITPRSASDIETIICALEEELKKTGTEIATISVASAHGEEVPSSVGEVSLDDMQASYVDTSGQTVEILQGQEIVEVQHVDNVIWTSEGEVQILDASQILDAAHTEEGVVYEGQPLHAQYDVVEYEVLTDKKQKRGRKRKFRDESTGEKQSLVDRTCPMCHCVLNYASSMTAHMRIHTGVKPYSCGQCDRKFTTKANRDRHEATHVGLKPFKCNECSKSFTEKRSLKIHMRTHTGERPFVCEVCGHGFTQKCTLQVHMDRHTNKKGHLCDLCGKAFRQKCQLDVHVKRHNRQALYPCHECSTKCYTKGDLVRHMIKHTGERPFNCKLCPRAFTRKQYLMDHENQHYGRKPYRCSVCSATFHDMGSCHRHLKKHKLEKDGDDSKSPTHSALLSSSDFHRILEGTQIGQILKLDDGSDALVKAVVSEADGSTVYHITCLGKSDVKEDKLPHLAVEEMDSSAFSYTADVNEETTEK